MEYFVDNLELAVVLEVFNEAKSVQQKTNVEYNESAEFTSLMCE